MTVFFRVSSSRLQSDEDLFSASCFSSSRNPSAGLPEEVNVLPVVVSHDEDVVDELQEVEETEQEARGSGDEEESMETSPDEMLDPPSSDLPCKRIASSSFLFARKDVI